MLILPVLWILPLLSGSCVLDMWAINGAFGCWGASAVRSIPDCCYSKPELVLFPPGCADPEKMLLMLMAWSGHWHIHVERSFWELLTLLMSLWLCLLGLAPVVVLFWTFVPPHLCQDKAAPFCILISPLLLLQLPSVSLSSQIWMHPVWHGLLLAAHKQPCWCTPCKVMLSVQEVERMWNISWCILICINEGVLWQSDVIIYFNIFS